MARPKVICLIELRTVRRTFTFHVIDEKVEETTLYLVEDILSTDVSSSPLWKRDKGKAFKENCYRIRTTIRGDVNSFYMDT